MKRIVALFAAIIGLVAILGAARAQDLTAKSPQPSKPSETHMSTGFLNRTLKLANVEHKYVVYVPRDYDPGKSWPAIFFMHGSGECGVDGYRQLAQGIAENILWNVERWPCVVLLPQKPDSDTQWEEYDAALMRMLEDTRREFNIDASRIALTGLSQGGHGTLALAAAHPDIWSAIAPFCAYSEPLTPDEIATKIQRLPAWFFHGEKDDVVPPRQTRDVVAALERLGAHPKLTLYPDAGHNCWDAGYSDPALPEWLLSQRRP